VKPQESEEVVKPIRKKRKKGLTEKDLDYDEVFDDDNDEDAIKEDDDDDDENEENLSDDGKKVKDALKEN